MSDEVLAPLLTVGLLCGLAGFYPLLEAIALVRRPSGKALQREANDGKPAVISDAPLGRETVA